MPDQPVDELPVVVRVTLLPRLPGTEVRRHRRDRELLRLLGQPARVEHLQAPATIAQVAEQARALGARAVLVESWPGEAAELVELARTLAPVTVLRPHRERRPGFYAGPPEERVTGYRRLHPDGEIEGLADGALA